MTYFNLFKIFFLLCYRIIQTSDHLTANFSFEASESVSDIMMNVDDKWVEIFKVWNNNKTTTTTTTTTRELEEDEKDDEYVLTFEPNKQYLVHKILRKEDPIRVVSIMGAPFLYEDDSFHSQYQTCIQDTIVCKKPIQNGSSTIWQLTCCYGYSVDLIKEISKILGSQMKIYLVEDKKYGGFVPEKNTFNGMIGDVIQGKADIAIAGLTINNQRLEYVDFTTPFMRTEIGIVTLKTIKENTDYLNFNFIANLSVKTLYAIVIFFLLAMFIVFGIDRTALYFKNQFKHKFYNRRQAMYSVYECFTYMSGLSFQRDLSGKLPLTLGARVTSLFFAFAMMAISTVYTASLTASKVVVSEQDTFKGLKDPRVSSIIIINFPF